MDTWDANCFLYNSTATSTIINRKLIGTGQIWEVGTLLSKAILLKASSEKAVYNKIYRGSN